jgi:hypothetical protein
MLAKELPLTDQFTKAVNTINDNVTDTAAITKQDARNLEREGWLPQAAQMYEQLLKATPSSIPVLERLMIVYRKLKAYKKEIIAIDKAIKLYESQYGGADHYDVKVASISKKLNSLLGHADKKGKSLLVIPEVARLAKRKATALKRLK